MLLNMLEEKGGHLEFATIVLDLSLEFIEVTVVRYQQRQQNSNHNCSKRDSYKLSDVA